MHKKFEEIRDRILYGNYKSNEEIKEDLNELYKIGTTTKNKKFECEVFAYYNILNKKIIK